MKILLDPQIYNVQKYGGISRYYTAIFSILSKKKELRIMIPLNNSTNIYFNQSPLVNIKQKIYSSFIFILKVLEIINQLKPERFRAKNVKNIIKGQDYDLFIPTYYDSYFVKWIGTKPFVLTVYDMIYELFPEYFINEKKVVANKRFLMQQATRIIAVSENTKKDIVKIYPDIDESKIDVVYHGCSIKSNVKEVGFLPKKYILFVGKRAIYKNFIFLVNSVAELLKNDSNLFLICAGGGDFNFIEKELLTKLGVEKQIVQMYFKENELAEFYKKAICFVFPSQYEGFGIPILEAMTCGCPVVLANHSSFPEVAGIAGFYYELNNSYDLRNKIYSLIENETLRNEYSLKGFEQVKKFSWEKAARECLAVYKKACIVK